MIHTWDEPIEDAWERLVAPVVYILYDEDGVPLYVGMTNALLQRFQSHRNSAPWWGEVSRVTFREMPSRGASLDEEERLIEVLAPRWNIRKRGSR